MQLLECDLTILSEELAQGELGPQPTGVVALEKCFDPPLQPALGTAASPFHVLVREHRDSSLEPADPSTVPFVTLAHTSASKKGSGIQHAKQAPATKIGKHH